MKNAMVLIDATELEEIVERSVTRAMEKQKQTEQAATLGVGDEPLTYRTREAAKKLGISEGTLRKLRNDSDISNFKEGNIVFYPADGLRVWIARGAAHATCSSTNALEHERA